MVEFLKFLDSTLFSVRVWVCMYAYVCVYAHAHSTNSVNVSVFVCAYRVHINSWNLFEKNIYTLFKEKKKKKKKSPKMFSSLAFVNHHGFKIEVE